MTLTQRFGRLLAAHRRQSGMRQSQLAEAADLSLHMVAKLETGAAAPSFASMERLARALRVDVAQLFTHELVGKPNERRELTDLVAELAPLSDGDLKWVASLVRVALKTRS